MYKKCVQNEERIFRSNACGMASTKHDKGLSPCQIGAEL